MKALDILNSINKRYCTDSVIEKINKAIAELEALENRSCEGCKNYMSDNGNFPLYPCSECSRFYADSWKKK